MPQKNINQSINQPKWTDGMIDQSIKQSIGWVTGGIIDRLINQSIIKLLQNVPVLTHLLLRLFSPSSATLDLHFW
jgi:hypothetical protein